MRLGLLFCQGRNFVKNVNGFGLKLTCLTIAILLLSKSLFAQVTTVFSYTGGTQNYTVPAGVSSIIVDVVGGTGGANSVWANFGGSTSSRGGNGGRVQCVLAVTAGSVLQVVVGGAGGNGTTSSGTSGGYNGGGSAPSSGGSYGGGGGGGASDIRLSPYATANRVVVAGGGGGAGSSTAQTNERGGDGGGLTGQNGFQNGTNSGSVPGQGGTSSAGGAGGVGNPGGAGGLGFGGNGVSGSNASGGGGSGYYGGGGAGVGSGWSGGGGGSSYTDPVLASYLIHTQGMNVNGNGVVIITTVPTGYTPKIFGYTGSSQTYTVPSNVSQIVVDAQGGMGGCNETWPTTGTWPSAGGSMGRVVCTLAVTSGQSFQVNIGGAGGNANIPTSSPVFGTGGWNGGGKGGVNSTFSGGGGGGATDMRVSPFGFSNRLIVAGGGGGAGMENPSNEYGGPGGGTTGGAGFSGGAQNSNAGQGGTPSAGGVGGGASGVAGSLGTGANAINTGWAGGGAGGLYGGGSGNNTFGASSGGGGGSSYTDPVLASGVTHTQGFAAIGNGTMIIMEAPSSVAFTGGSSQNYTVCKNASAQDITSLLTANDPVSGHTLTWSISSGPANGSLGGFNATATSTGGNVTPSGLTYTPTSGYNGTDAFTIQISNGVGGTTTTTINVTVNPMPITGTQTVCVGSTTTLSDASTGGTWSSASTGYATVGSSSGVVTGVNAGTVNITYTHTCGGTTIAVVTVNPVPAPITGVASVCVGATTNLVESIGGGTWTSGSPGIATIGSATGAVTGVSPGTALMTYAFPTGCFVTQTVTVNALPASAAYSVTTNPVCQNTLSTFFSGVAATSYSWNFGDGGTATGNSVSHTYTVSGTYTSALTVTNAAGCTLSSGILVTVNPLPSAIAGTPTVCVGFTTTLSNALPGGTWSSASPAVGSIGSATGIVAGLTPGTTVITYTLPTGCFITTTVTVNPNPGAIGGTFTVCQGLSTAPLTDGTSGGNWTSDNVTIATIGSSSAIVSGVSAGTDIITYTLPTGCFAAQLITVNPLPASIAGSAAVCVGLTTTLTDATSGGTWSSGTPANGSIDAATGILTGIAPGNTLITYTLPSGCINTVTASVNNNPTAITGTLIVCTGLTTTLNSTPAGGTWSSSDITKGTVGAASGIVSGIAAGTTIITYQLGTGCIATAVVTVNQTPTAIGGTAVVCVGSNTTLSDAVTGGTWSSSAPAQGTVFATTGVVTGIASGTTNIIYTMPTGCSNFVVVTVNPLPAAIAGTFNVCEGLTTTLTDATTPGTWTSSNPSSGSVGSVSGAVTGISANTLTITYTLNATGCAISAPFTVNPTPAAIAGTSTVCTGINSTLTDATTGGTWSSSVPANGTVGSTTGVVTGIAAGNTNIIYTLPAGCTATKAITVNQTPVPVSGANTVCVGLTTTLTDGTGGGTWSSNNPGQGSVGSASGVVGGISAGTPTISYTMPTGCFALQPFTVNPTPAAISGTLVVCQNGTTALSDATGGGIWSTSNPAIGTVGTSSGIVTGIGAGNANVIYTLAAGCTATAVLTVNPAPNTTNFTSPTSTSPCQGTGAVVTVNSTTLGVGTFTVTYNLSGANSATANTATLIMTGSTGTFTVPAGALPNTGSTTVTITLLTNSFGCNTTVSSSNSVAFTVNILPTAYNVLGTGSYCSGGTGIHIFLSSSVGGVNYQLFLGGSPVGAPVAGTFSSLDMGAQTAAGVYTVVGTNTTTLCNNNMTGSATISINPLPTAFNVTGGGSYCAGGTGVAVGLSSSTAGVSYQLFVGGSPSGSAVSGTGGVISFGLRTAAGTYIVVATNTTTGCVNTMTGSVTIIINPLPNAITGSLGVCIGQTTTLASSTAGGTWTSVNTAVGTVGSTTGVVAGITAGTTLINYTLTATGCSTSATVTVNPLPSAIAGGGVVCTGSTITLIDPTGSGTWSSSNPGVGTVGATTGIVGGIAAGNVTITYALATGCIATTGVTVNNTPPAITGTAIVCVGSTTTLFNATSGGAWTSNNSAQGTVGAGTGVVGGIAAGNPVISYTIAGCSATIIVTVNPLPAAIAGTFNACEGSTTTLTDATTGGTWSSSNPANGSVSVTGVVAGITAGNPLISYTLGTGCFVTTSFTVNPTPAAIVGVSTVCIGLTTTLSDVTAGGTWSSSNTAVGTVGAGTGIVGGISSGTPVITYTLAAGNCNRTFPMTVNPNPAAITGSNQVCLGLTTVLSDASTGGTWSSSSPANGSISATGVVTGVSAGNTTITYTMPTGCIVIFPMTVNPLPASITGTTTVCVGFTTTLADASAGGSWSTSNPAMATVGTGTGVVTGTGAGTPNIIYTLPTGCTATTPVTVNPTPASIVGSNTICTGSTTTLTDATGGGLWSCSNLTIATIGSSSGLVTPVVPGIVVMTYTLPAGCTATLQMTVNLQPAAITGASTVCTGFTTALSDATAGGTWASSNTAAGTISAGGIVNAIAPGTTTITYTMPGGCFSAFPMTVNPQPAAVSGPGAVCVLANITMTDATTGGLWSSSNTAFATVGSVSGIVTGVAAGNVNIIYTLPAGCTSAMAITVNPLPASITGLPVVCVNSTVTIFDATTGGTWSSSNIGLATIGSSTGVITGVTAGNPVLSYTLTATGCFVTVIGTVNPLPNSYTVTGGGAYCAGGTGVTVGLSSSDIGFSYQLFNGTAVGSPVSGTGSALSFGLQTTAGTYTVVATNNTTGCIVIMSGSALVTINALPTAFSLTGGGPYCAGSAGVAIGLNPSSSGKRYQLLIGGVVSGSPVIGTGSAISFGLRTGAGAYTVLATDTLTGCTNMMTGIASISINPLPTAYTITGGGGYCVGGTGVTVGLSSSNIGINYTLLLGASPVTTIAGTGASISFGLQTALGVYTIQATNTTTGCQSIMTGSVVISTNPVPNIFTLSSAAGTYCAGGTGVLLSLSGSQPGTTYQLYLGGAPVGAPVAGTGLGINFGLQTAAGTYTAIATNSTTGCTSNMTGSPVVTITPLPTAFTVYGGGGFCALGTGVTIFLSGSQPGVNYNVYLGGSLVATIPGTGGILSAVTTTGGTYTVIAVSTVSPFCQNNMIGSALVTINPLPTAYAVTGGGAYCAGLSGVHVGLANSDLGINYQLYVGGSPFGLPLAGTGSALDFGFMTVAGNYTVTATNATTLCANGMAGSATVTISPLPVLFNVSGGGSYCAGGTGVTITLSGSAGGINYQLFNGTTTVGPLVAGTGSALTFGPLTAPATYTIIATNPVSGCTTSMSGSATISISPLPTVFNVTGGGSYCAGGTGVVIGLNGSVLGTSYQLYNGVTSSGVPLIGTGVALNFGLRTAAGTYIVKATDPITGCINTMTGSAIISINPLPTVYTVTGGGAYCAGGTGVPVGLNNSSTGINYQLLLGGSPVGAPVAGTGGALSFGLQTSVGTYTVMATNATTSCTLIMGGSVAVSINPLPVPYTVTGGGNYCIGGIGVPVGLTGSVPGISYQLFNGGSPVGLPVPGSGSGLPFGLQTAAGTYTVVATNDTTGCTSAMTGSVTVIINPLPVAYTVTGGGAYCAGGTGVHIGLYNSAPGVSYQLYYGTSIMGTPVTGTGSAIDFGLQTVAGTYTVTATDLTTGCINSMTGSVTVIINPLPAAFTVTGGGGYCTGGTGLSLGLSGSVSGDNYQLYKDGIVVGSPVAGTGSLLDFGYHTAAGVYTVTGITSLTGCANGMTGSATITINPLPTAYMVTGGGAYCAGGSGQHVGLSGSDIGINYQLWRGTSMVGSPMAGTGLPLDFGIFTATGIYTIAASDAVTACMNNMGGSVTIIINPLPVVFNVTGGGSYCAGGTGFHIGLSGSAFGTYYQLFNGGTAFGTPVAGTGSSLDFGVISVAGNYTVIAIAGGSLCTSNMSGSATITINPMPVMYTVTGGGNYCPGGVGAHIGLNGSDLGINYRLYNGLSLVTTMAGNDSTLDFGLQTATGTYTIAGVNATSGCTSNMISSAVISINTLPAVFSVTGGGSYCAGGTGVHITLGGSASGINYQLYRSGIAVGAPVAGTGFTLDLGVQSFAGTYTAMATNATTGCTVNMTGTAIVAINPLPVVYTLAGGGSYCAGGTVPHVTLSGSDAGIHYQLFRSGVASGGPVPGTGSLIDFGALPTSGVYTVVATDAFTGCTSNMIGGISISVNPLPIVYSVVGGGSYCAGGTGMVVSMTGSESGISYQLYADGILTGTPHIGTGSAISFGSEVTAGVYTVIATNIATGCTNNMTGAATVAVNALPGLFNVLGGGSYCVGGSGMHVGLSGSAVGISYRLLLGVTPVGSAVPGTGAAVDFGPQTSAGTYRVSATNIVTGCNDTMTGSVTIVINPLPVTYTVTGGGNYCSGTSGITVGLSASDMGILYQLYEGTTAMGIPVAGTGSAISFGLQTLGGTYTVVAVNNVTSCSSPMAGSTLVTIIPSVTPLVTINTGAGDTVCDGISVTFTALVTNGGSSPTYQWYVNSGSVVSASGAYTYTPANGDVVSVILTSNATCAAPATANDAVTMTVNVNVLPVVTISSALGDSLCGATPVTLTLSSVYGGTAPAYNWYLNSMHVGSGTTLGFTPVNNDVVFVTMTSNYNCKLDTSVLSNNIHFYVDHPDTPVVEIDYYQTATVDSYQVLVTNDLTHIYNYTYQWYVNGTLQTMITTSYLILAPGSIPAGSEVSCVVLRHNPCGAFPGFGSYNLSNVSVKPVTFTVGDVKLIPNPNNGIFNLKGTTGAVGNQDVNIEVTDMLGQVVFKESVIARNGEIDEHIQLNNLANGMYILNMHVGAGNKVFHMVIEQ